MTENWNFQDFIFKLSKDDIADTILSKQDILFDESVQRFDDFEKRFYKTSIEVTKFYERFDMFQIDESISFYNNFNFSWIHFNVIYWDN